MRVYQNRRNFNHSIVTFQDHVVLLWRKEGQALSFPSGGLGGVAAARTSPCTMSPRKKKKSVLCCTKARAHLETCTKLRTLLDGARSDTSTSQPRS